MLYPIFPGLKLNYFTTHKVVAISNRPEVPVGPLLQGFQWVGSGLLPPYTK
jgi:hypothetical protein